MPYIMTLLEVGRMLHVPIPRALVRELGLVKRQHVSVRRDSHGCLVVQLLDDYLRERPGTADRSAR
ncbi:MAG: hypothetical protein AUH33_04150 [Chloroflexi bacterium 13_1_40CM_68_21]|nr:MAG: hypothetical protein AUH33_04150 [Chloroflexi bacterium 13_1_40CM_68_21]